MDKKLANLSSTIYSFGEQDTINVYIICYQYHQEKMSSMKQLLTNWVMIFLERDNAVVKCVLLLFEQSGVLVRISSALAVYHFISVQQASPKLSKSKTIQMDKYHKKPEGRLVFIYVRMYVCQCLFKNKIIQISLQWCSYCFWLFHLALWFNMKMFFLSRIITI